MLIAGPRGWDNILFPSFFLSFFPYFFLLITSPAVRDRTSLLDLKKRFCLATFFSITKIANLPWPNFVRETERERESAMEHGDAG